MKNNNKKTSLAVLSILAGVIYFIMLIPYFEAGWEGGARNVRAADKAQLNDGTKTEGGSKIPYHIQLGPKNNDVFYSDSIVNIRTGQLIPVSYTRMDVSNVVNKPNSGLTLLMTIMAFIGGSTFLVIPFVFYKLILSFYNDQIFVKKNIRRIRTLGILYLILYVFKLGYNLTNYYVVKSTVELENYHIIKPDLGFSFLLIAILMFIIVVVMKRVMIMKEEQDLTI